MYNKIRITGGSGSGKTTLGKLISDFLNVELSEMERLTYDFSKTTKFINKYSFEKRTFFLNELIKKDCWILEGSYYTFSKQSYVDSDLIIYLRVGVFKRIINIIIRFFSRLKTGEYEGITCFLDLLIYNLRTPKKWKKREKLFKKLYSDKFYVFNSADEAFEWFKTI